MSTTETFDQWQQRQSYQEARRQQPKPNIFQRGLELLGKPAEYAAKGLEFMLPGGPPTTQISSFEDILKGRGVGELGRLGPVTGRGALGFLGSMATDPLNLLWAVPPARIATLARGAARAAPLAERAGAAAPGGIAAFESQLAGGFAPTAASRAGQAATRLPIAGKPIRWSLAKINPNAVADTEMQRVLSSFAAGTANIPNKVTGQYMPALRQGWQQVGFQTDDIGRVQLRNGSYRSLQDLAQMSDEAVRPLLEPQQYAYLQQAKQAWAQVFSQARDMGVGLGELGASERQLLPRLALRSPEPGGRGGFVPFLTRQGVQRERKYATMEQGIAAGQPYADFLTSMEVKFSEIEEAMLVKRLTDELVARGIAAAPKAGVATAQAAVKQARTQLLTGEITQEEYAAARKVLTKARVGERARLAGLLQIPEEEIKGVAGATALKGMRFRPEDAQAIRNYFTQTRRAEASALGRMTYSLQGVSNTVRTMRATMDLSGFSIQGLVPFFMQPGAWAKAVSLSLRSLFDTGTGTRYLARHSADYARWPGLIMDNPEFTGAARAQVARQIQRTAGGTGREVLGLERPFLQRVPPLRAVYQPFTRAFDVMGNVARTEMMLAMEPLARSPQELQALISFVNRATGVLSTQALGISAGQRAVENSWLLFSPRFTRATLSLVGDTMQGGLRGNLAREAMGRMLFVGTAMFIKTAEALGLDEAEIERRLDPSKGSFMTLPIMGQNMGVGSTYVALARLLGRSFQEPEALTQFNLATLDTGNPLVAFFRGRAAPLGGLAADFWTKETYLGEPLQSNIDIGLHLGKQTLPFALETVLYEGALKGQIPREAVPMAGAALTGLGGARAFPQGVSDIRQQVSRELFGQPYEELGPIQQAQVDRSERIRAVPEREGRRFERSRAMDTIFDRYEQETTEAAGKLFAGEWTPFNFRQALSQIRQERNVRLGEMEPTEARTPEGVAYQGYLAFFDVPPGTEVDYEAQEAYLAGLPPATQGYIEEKLAAGDERFTDERTRNLLKELRQDRKELEPYWTVWEDTLRKRGLWEQWRDASPAERDRLMDTRPFKRADSIADRSKKRLRRRQPEIDLALLKWGYVSAPQSAAGRRQQRGEKRATG